jgi:signal peptidase I
MDINFPLLLSILVLVSGFIWLLDIVWLQRVRTKKSLQKKSPITESLLVEYSKSLFPVFFVVLFLRSFLIQPFQIPSGSMEPTLEVGDFILVNMFAYGIRLPVIDYKIIEVGEPKRGDVMVFRYPNNPKVNYIKRVIGLPGDHIVYKDKVLTINGRKMEQTFEAQVPAWLPELEIVTEHLSGVAHTIQHKLSAPGMEVDLVVPDGQYFMMGDNRDNSNDSRFWGAVPETNIAGKAFAIWMHKDPGLSLPSFSRVGIIK